MTGAARYRIVCRSVFLLQAIVIAFCPAAVFPAEPSSPVPRYRGYIVTFEAPPLIRKHLELQEDIRTQQAIVAASFGTARTTAENVLENLRANFSPAMEDHRVGLRGQKRAVFLQLSTTSGVSAELSMLASRLALRPNDRPLANSVENVLNAIQLDISETDANIIQEIPSVLSVSRNYNIHTASEHFSDFTTINQTVEAWKLRNDWPSTGNTITGKGISIGILDNGFLYDNVSLGGPGCTRQVYLSPPIGCPVKVKGGMDLYNTVDMNFDGSYDGCFIFRPGLTSSPLTGAYCENDFGPTGEAPFFRDKNDNGTSVSGGLQDCYDYIGSTNPGDDDFTGLCNDPLSTTYYTEKDFDPYTEVPPGGSGYYHGTQVSIIAAGSFGASRGVAPDADLYLFKMQGGSSADQPFLATVIDFLRGMDAVVDLNGDGVFDDPVDVVNMSITTGFSGFSEDEASQAVDNLADAGVVVVVAAGNAGPGGNAVFCRYEQGGLARSICSPGAAANAITVGGTSDNDEILLASSRGPACVQANCLGNVTIDKPDLVALGTGFVPNTRPPFDGVHNASGTSFSAPQVAGAAAMLLQAYPVLLFPPQFDRGLSARAVKSLLTGNTEPIGPDPWTYGTGRLDVLNAVANWVAVRTRGNLSARITSQSTFDQDDQLNCLHNGSNYEGSDPAMDPPDGCKRHFLIGETVIISATPNASVSQALAIWDSAVCTVNPLDSLSCELVIPSVAEGDEPGSDNKEINVTLVDCSDIPLGLDPAEEALLRDECALSDLQVQSLTTSPPRVLVNENSVSIEGVVLNAGETGSDQGFQNELDIYRNTDGVASAVSSSSQSVALSGPMAVGEMRPLSFAQAFSPTNAGTYILRANTDSTKVIEEENEANNTRDYALEVGPPLEYALFLAKDGAGRGIVTSSQVPEIDCDVSCEGKVVPVADGEVIQLHPIPENNPPDNVSTFGGWTGCDSVDGNDVCNVTLDSQKFVTAKFTEVGRYRVHVNLTNVVGSAGSSGFLRIYSSPPGIDCTRSRDCTGHFPEGTDVTLFAEPVVGLNQVAFLGWRGTFVGFLGHCDSIIGNQCIIENIHDDQLLWADFYGTPPTFPPCSINLTKIKIGGGNGTFEGHCSGDPPHPCSLSCNTRSYYCSTAPEPIACTPNAGFDCTPIAVPCTLFGSASECGNHAFFYAVCFHPEGSGTSDCWTEIYNLFDPLSSSLAFPLVLGGEADLRPMDVIVSPIDVKPGAAVRFYGLVENRGEGDASSTETVFNVYEEGSPGNWAKIVSTSETTDAIDLYSSTFVASSYTWTAPPEPLFSRYKFEMCVDGNNSVVELDENNNCAEVELPNTSVAVAKVESAGASGTVRSISSPSQDEISCAPTCSRSYSFFTTLQLLAEPDEGSVFGGWGEACEAFGYDERCLLEMDRDKAVLAWFEKLLYGDLDRNGVVSVTDALTALAIAVGQMSPTDYQLLAGDVNLDGNIFVTDVLLILSASLGSVQLPQATLSNLTIQVTKSGNGMGELVSKKYGIFEPGFCGFDCGPVELWKEGQKVVIRPRPDPGSILVGWRGVCAGTGKNCRVRVKNISEAEVVFEEPSPTTPDLVVESLRLSPRVGKMKAGKNLRVTAKIKNIGDVPSLPFEVTLRVDVDDNGFGDGNDIEEFLTIPSSLAKNRRILRRWRNVWVITPGIHQVEVCADSDGAVAELHEDNDCNYTTIFVPAN